MLGEIIVENCSIVNNWSADSYGGGLSFDWGGTYVRNSLIASNSAISGGGIYLRCAGSIQNCTIVSNTARTSVGGGVYCISGSLAIGTGSVENTIIYLNTAPNNPSYSNYYSSISGGRAYFTNCCMSPVTNAGVLGGVGCIDANPQFANKDNDNWRLTASSPCINVGLNEDWMTNAVDLDDRQRIRYGTVDIGAYEKIYGGTFYTIP